MLRQRPRGWIVAVLGTGLDELEQVARRLASNLDAVIAGHQHDVPLGRVESINGRIATLRRQAHGYRDPEHFKLRILQRCSLSDNPRARIVP